jgi:uncharacterized protein
MFPVAVARASLLAFVTSTAAPSSRTFLTTSMMLHAVAGGSGSSGSGGPPPPPLQYVLHYRYVPDVLEKRGPYRERHLALAKELCLSGGPTAPLASSVPPTGALFIFGDLAAAQSFVDQDPYVDAGIVTEHRIEEWTVAIQN